MIRDYLLHDYTVSSEILVSPLKETDLGFTLESRNMPGVREFFFDQRVISCDMHRQWFDGYLTKQNECMFCIFFNGVRAGQIGFYNYDQQQRSLEVGRLFVASRLQGHGIMKATLRHLLAHMCGIEIVDKIVLYCKRTNSRAIDLYDSLGFREISRQSKLAAGDISMKMIYLCGRGRCAD